MPKNKFGFWLVFVLVAGLCVNLLASDKDVSLQYKLKCLKDNPLFQKEARIPFPASGGIFEPPDLWNSQKTEKLTKAVNGTGAISGLVYQASRGVSIEGVEITAEQLLVCPAHSSSDYSDEHGYYLIDGLPPGKYVVSTDNEYLLDSTFVDVYWDDKLDEEDADTVPVASNDTTEGIDFNLRVGGKITGTVTVPEAPLWGITITATDTVSKRDYSGEASDFVGGSADYVIKRLPTGIYKLNTSGFFSNYVDEYYDDKSSWASANPVSVTEGITTSPINFTLDSGAVIQGNVSIPGKGPLAGIPMLGFYASDPFEWSSYGVTEADGNYSLIGLRTGYWKILVYGDTSYAFEWYNDKDTWAGADSVYVTAPGTISGKNFILEPGGSISGHVYDLGGSPLSDCYVMAYQALTRQWGVSMGKGDNTSADGSYKIGGLCTGDYYVMASTECCTLWYDDQTNPQDADPVPVTMPSDHSGIDFNFPFTAVESEDEIARHPAEFELYQNYPNPFNPETRIKYTLKKAGHVTLHIYNVLGEKVKTLLDQDQSTGFYQINWDGKNDKGKSVSSGLYLYKLEVNGFSQAKRMLLLK
jgi:hypothetical protein